MKYCWISHWVKILKGSAAEILKSQVFLYEADTDRLEEAYKGGSAVATDILESYAKAADSSQNYHLLTKQFKSSPMSQLLVMYRQTCCHQEVMLIPDRTENYMGNVF